MPILKYPAVFLTSGLLCWVGLLILGRWAPRLKLLDVPRTRHPHARPVPLVGGLAIFGAFFGACLLIFWGPWGDFRGRLDGIWCGKFLIIAGVFTLLGVLDDRLEWKPRWKLAGQVLGAVAAYLLDVRFGRVLGLPVPVGLDLVATIVWFVAMVNAFNLIDGMDGVATGMAITGGLGLLILFGLQR
ncbi:MAG: undecaprenyl/decaprenyl-phosphate alpha-N-acetylglucosaminyl 1-phosphate transferase, partial [Lentisphaerae bacterium]|nr:undecaprenyl/decaprenyl-phosphate alpha-N-acetylglucosaminyl 1-phosphate transferase [Lentisphaerota bacterium]